MNLQHDIPVQSIRGRRARISAVDPDNPHNVWVAFRGERGAPEPAYYPSNTTPVVGKDVRVTAEPELKRWKVEDYSSGEAAECSITLRKVWEMPVSGSRVRAHPTHKQYIAVADGSDVVVLDWEAETTADTEAIGSLVRDIAWSPDGLWLAVIMFASPRIKVFPFDPVTGLLGSAVSDPATAGPSDPGGRGCVRWHPSGYAIFSTTGTSSDLVTGWSFVGGALGANIPTFFNHSMWGVKGNENHWLNFLGVWTPSAATLSDVDGMDINPVDGTLVLAVNDGESIHFHTAWHTAIDETFDPTDFGWGMRFDSDPDGSGPPTYGWKHPVFSPDGTLLAFHANNTSSPGSGNDVLGEAGVRAFGGREFGIVRSNPRHDQMRHKWTDGPYGNRDLNAWRPGRSTNQLMVPVAPQTFGDPPNLEPRLDLWRFEGDRFAHRCTYLTDIPDDFDWGGLQADSNACWTHDGDTFLAIPENYLAFADLTALLVFDVEGDP